MDLPIKVFDLAFSVGHYYIKRSSIVEKISFNNRTFYAKFERIDEPFNSLLLKQHLDRQYTIALPLVHNNTTNYLLIEYNGDESQRFYHLIKHLFKTLNITNYSICEGKDIARLQIFIPVFQLTLEEADRQLEHLSHSLQQKMSKKWKCLPSLHLPEAYNIVTIPYKIL